MHSWRVLLLPYMEQSQLYEQYRFDEPRDGPNNRKLASQMPAIFRCPSYLGHEDEKEGAEVFTTCVAIVSPNGVFRGANATRLADISDDLGETILVADVNQGTVHWMSPVDISPDELIEEVARIGKDTNHPTSIVTLCADGSRRLLTKDTTEESIRAMTTTNAND